MVKYNQILDIFGKLKQQDFITKLWGVGGKGEGRNKMFKKEKRIKEKKNIS